MEKGSNSELTLFKENAYYKSTSKTLIINKDKFIEILKNLSNGTNLQYIKLGRNL